MASFRLLFLFHLLLLLLFHLSSSLITDPNSLYQTVFSFPKFRTSIDPSVHLTGDARSSSGTISLTGNFPFSKGRIVYRIPIKMFRGKPKKPISFLSHFAFSISPGNSTCLIFSVTKKNEESSPENTKVFGVELETSAPDLISVRVSNVSAVGLTKNNGEKMNCWIRYDSNARLVEVRIGNSTEFLTCNPMIMYSIDLSKIWSESMFVGITGLSSNSSQVPTVYSWSFSKMYSHFTLHSQPVDPEDYSKISKEVEKVPKRNVLMGILAALVFGVGCGSMITLAFMLVSSHMAVRRPTAIAPEVYSSVHPVPISSDYEKIEVVDKKANA